ncbi:MAG TPA: type III-B CRISPR module-associated Cmr3 family protein [Thermoanaerobaculia bacterium]
MSGGKWSSFQAVPDDVLFFRDGKPSSIGADHYLRSLFPPNPATLYGALRTRRLMDGGVELGGLGEATWRERLGALEAELGPWGGFGSLELRGPWLVKDGVPLLPAPADLGLIFEKSSHAGPPRIAEVFRFRPVEAEGDGRWSHPLALLAPFAADGERWISAASDREPRPASGWFLTPAGLSAWRAGGVPAPGDFVHASDLWRDEPRTGIGLQSGQRSGKDGMLYTFGFVRLLPGVALGFEVTGSELETAGRVKLGGEGRTAMLEPGPAFPAAQETAKSERFCLYFVTPALSESGGYPPGFSAGRLDGELAGRSCRLTAAVLPGFSTAGGWDVANASPKPLRRAIPAGSVFLFEGAPDLIRELDGTCLSGFPDLARQGFGLAVTGISR